jgi:hypothetical protein
VAREIDCAVDCDRKVHVHLNDTRRVALIPVVSTPGFAGDIFNREVFTGREHKVCSAPFASLRNCRVKHTGQLFRWNNELELELFKSFMDFAGSGKQVADIVDKRRKVLFRKHGRLHVV